MSHPKQDRMLEFASGQAGQADAERIYSHLADCDPCSERLSAIQRLRSDFEGSWNAFIEEVGLRLANQAVWARPKTEKKPGLALALRGILDGSRRLATAARENVSGVLEAGKEIQAVFVPAYQGVADPEGGEEGRRFAEKASTLCLDGEVSRALEELEKAANADAAVAAAAQIDFVSKAGVVGRAVVDSVRRSVSLMVYPEVFGHDSGTVVLDLTDAPGVSSRRAPLLRIEGAPYLMAEFEDVPDGAFTLELEVTGR